MKRNLMKKVDSFKRDNSKKEVPAIPVRTVTNSSSDNRPSEVPYNNIAPCERPIRTSCNSQTEHIQDTLGRTERSPTVSRSNSPQSTRRCAECRIVHEHGTVWCDSCNLHICVPCREYGHRQTFACYGCKIDRCMSHLTSIPGKPWGMCWFCALKHTLLDLELSSRDVVHCMRDGVLHRCIAMASHNRSLTYAAMELLK